MSKQPFPKDRHFTRVALELEATVVPAQGPIAHGHIHDLSVRGVLFAGAPELLDGQGCVIEIHPKGRTTEPTIRARGRIERVTEFGTGVEFIDVEERFWHELRKLAVTFAPTTETVQQVEQEFRKYFGSPDH